MGAVVGQYEEKLGQRQCNITPNGATSLLCDTFCYHIEDYAAPYALIHTA